MEMNMDLAKKIVDACYEDAKKKGLDMVFLWSINTANC